MRTDTVWWRVSMLPTSLHVKTAAAVAAAVVAQEQAVGLLHQLDNRLLTQIHCAGDAMAASSTADAFVHTQMSQGAQSCREI
jgi:hypothetical protein